MAGLLLGGSAMGGCAGSPELEDLLALQEQLRGQADASELTVVGFNLESGDAAPAYLAREYFAPLSGVDLWGLSEVQNEGWIGVLEEGAEAGEGANFTTIFGSTGGGDRLAIIYNEALLELIAFEELEELSFEGRVRAPLVAQFQIRETAQQFLFMVNHLYRSDAEKRHQQARWLNQWGRSLPLPVIAVGDYNFDFDVEAGDAGKRDLGFDLMTAEGIFTWVRPQPLTTTYCSDRYNSVLDFVFVANEAARWPVTAATIPYADTPYCPDTAVKSDHFPVMVTFDLAQDATEADRP
ncbi:MAG: endonuclease/exonuclease/phosphatase family protein [Elainellaceae cyanobacterium]